MTEPTPGMQRLERAVGAWLAFQAGGPGADRAAFLAAHADLRDLLEPMLEEPAASAASTGPLADGRELGDFRLIRELGRGGMGVVYEAQQLSLPRRVALKVLAAHLTLRPESVARFRAEAVIAARLEHPGIVRILAQGAAADAHYFAMELLHAASLQDVLARLRTVGRGRLHGGSIAAAVAAGIAATFPEQPPVPVTQGPRSHVEAAVEVVLQVADALEHGHGAGVVHRDVKPANILLRGDGSVVLTDFGLARDQERPGLTAPGTFAGTPHYTAPEQASGRAGAVDARSDLFSLGVCLYELLTLQRPFDGESSLQVLADVQSHEPRSPDQVDATIPSDLGAVVMMAMEKDCRRRYPSAAALAADLRAFLAHRPVQARRATALERLWRWRRREPVKAALLAVVLVAGPVLTAAAGYVYARRGEIAAGQAQLRDRQVEDLVDRGFLDFTLEAPDLGIGSFESALGQDPASAPAQLGLVMALQKRDGPEAAMTRLEAGLAPSREPGVAALLRCALLYRLGRHGEAAAIYHGLPEPRTELELFLRGELDRDVDTNAGTQLLEHVERAVLAAGRPHLWIHMHWAVFADEAGDAASCRRCAANLLLTWPGQPVALYFVAVALRHVDPDRAEQLVQAALRSDPQQAVLHSALGLLRTARGDAAGAVEAMASAVALAPQSAALHHQLGAARLRTGDVTGAIQEFDTAVRLRPGSIEAWIGLGMARRQAGDQDGALAALQQAADSNRNHAVARYQLGQQLLSMQRIDAAVVELRVATSIHGRDPAKWQHLAGALFAKGDADGGFAALRRAVAAAPQNERAHQMLVLALQQTHQPAAARAALAAWVEALPQSRDGWLHYGLDCVDPQQPAAQQDPVAAAWAARRALALGGDGERLPWLVLGVAEAALGRVEPARDALQHSLLAGGQGLEAAARDRAEALLQRLGPAPSAGR